MNTTVLSLLGYSAWSLMLLGGIAVLRGSLTATRARAANSFAPDGNDVSRFSGRLCRAHANCYERLPAVAAILLVAISTGNTGTTNTLAMWHLLARVAQSTVHLASTSERAVQFRFVFFLAQFLIEIYWTVGLVRIFLAV